MHAMMLARLPNMIGMTDGLIMMNIQAINVPRCPKNAFPLCMDSDFE
jgi:hypothetical protein